MWGKALQPSAIQMRTQMTNNRLIKHNKLTFYCNKLIQFLSLDISKREKKPGHMEHMKCLSLANRLTVGSNTR